MQVFFEKISAAASRMSIVYAEKRNLRPFNVRLHVWIQYIKQYAYSIFIIISKLNNKFIPDVAEVCVDSEGRNDSSWFCGEFRAFGFAVF